MPVSEALVKETILEIQRNQEAAEQKFQEEQATKVGEDPSRPWHPVLNPSREDMQKNWSWARQQDTRRKYLSVWDDAIGQIKAKRWTTRRQMAQHYQRSSSWICCMVQLMVHQKVFTTEELRGLLPGRFLKKKPARRRRQRQQPNQERLRDAQTREGT